MAFLGHIDSQGAMVSRKVFCSGAHQDDIETIEGSRTYIKTYDQKSLVQAMGSPSTVRYVGGSESSSEVNSLDEAESSILRRCLLESQRTLLAEHEEYADHGLDTGSETICLQLGSPGSTSRSASSSRSSSSRESCSQEKSSTTSMCSWEEAMSRGESMLSSGSHGEETRDFSMPSLHLGSDRYSAPMTYTRRIDAQRLERPSDEAYANWLSAKRQQAKYRRQAEQKSREEQLQREELRQRLSQERYELWCRQKAQQAPAAVKPKPAQPTQIPPKKSNPVTTNSRLKQWELEKLRQAEERRLQLRIAERRKQQEKLERQQQADHAFQRWMRHVDQRPKPVPSGQGMKSLRGTISDLYINPNQWVD